MAFENHQKKIFQKHVNKFIVTEPVLGQSSWKICKNVQERLFWLQYSSLLTTYDQNDHVFEKESMLSF